MERKETQLAIQRNPFSREMSQVTPSPKCFLFRLREKR
jgi:hypothetical protein